MKNIGNFCHNILNKFCQQGIADRANFLKNIAVIGWVLSSLAQTTAIVLNDKIPSKEKKFLIPQEIFDGFANITLFWFITSKATDLGKKLVLKKIVMPKSLTKILDNFTPKGKNIIQLKENFLAHITKFGTKKDVEIAQKAIDGMGVLTGITGAVIANNIVTPLVRNKLAGTYQRNQISKNPKYTPLNPYYGNIDTNDKLASDYKFNTFKGFFQNPNIKI